MKYFLLGISIYCFCRVLYLVILYKRLDKFGTRMLKVYSKLTLSIATSCCSNNNDLRIGRLVVRSLHPSVTYSGSQNLDTHLTVAGKFEFCNEVNKSDQFKMSKLFILTDNDLDLSTPINDITEESLINKFKACRFEQGPDNKLEMFLGEEKLDPRNKYDLKTMLKFLKVFSTVLYDPAAMHKNFVDIFPIDFEEFKLLKSGIITNLDDLTKVKDWKEV